ncbi:MAG: ribosomal RNA small subunit methyltransferase A [Alphaproteobacteria bacterium]|nr:MAG: ribosomal RNA small subunit methyltransferase A [Alphaproteobacteria bacterium]
MKFFTKKSLGQHYLTDIRKLDYISKYCLNISKNVLEIGPGTGQLTKNLFQNGADKIFAIEKDVRFIEYLEETLQEYDFTVRNEDVLKEKFENFTDDWVICGNLPYNISSIIITNFVKNIAKFKSGIFLVQKEMADRICATCNEKDYGRLSVFINSVASTKKILHVGPNCFSPPPKVDSTVIHIEPKRHSDVNLDKLDQVLKEAFLSPRKVAINNLKNLAISFHNLEQIFKKHNITEQSRPNNLPIELYIELSQML